MRKIIQHLRADAETWARADMIPEDGEIALCRTAGGLTRIKIGDGVSPFSALPYTDGEIRTEESDTVLLRHGAEHRLGERSLITLAFPAVTDEDFYATVSFSSPETPTTLYIPTSPAVMAGGDGVEDGVFVPKKSTHYTLLFWKDEAGMQLLVRGVSVA